MKVKFNAILVGALVGSAWVGLPGLASAQQLEFEIESIGTLSARLPDDSWASAINNRGLVGGTSYFTNVVGNTTPRPVRWNLDGLVELSNGLGGIAQINDAGTAAGFKSGFSSSKAYQWDLVGVGTRLHFGNLDTSVAAGINANGEVIGSYDYVVANPINLRRGFFRDSAGNYTSMPSLGGTASRAGAINNFGLIVGHADDVNDDSVAVTWQPGSQPVPMVLPGPGNPIAVNDSGQIVGVWLDSTGLLHGYFDDQGVVQDLPALFPGGDARPADVNQFGFTVGSSLKPGGFRHAVLWTRDLRVIKLHDLLPPNSGWRLESAFSINDLGEICGYGYLNNKKRGFRMTPHSPRPLMSGVQPAIVQSPESHLFAAKVSANSPVYFFWGTRAGRSWRGQYHVDIADPRLIGVAIADHNGRAQFPVVIPSTLLGRRILTQAVDATTGITSMVAVQIVR